MSPSTNAERIRFGETCTLDKWGNMQPATGAPDDSGAFKVKNEYGAISIGCNQNLEGKYRTVFMSPTVIIGTATFEQGDTVKAWFATGLETGTMIFFDGVGNEEPGIEVSFEKDQTKKHVAYTGETGAGAWTVLAN